MSPVVEVLRIANGGDQCACRDRPNARDHRKLATGIACPEPLFDLCIELIDLPVEFP
jgi:hypothetical protein